MTEENKPWHNFELVPLANMKSDYSLFDFQQWSIYQSLEKQAFILGLCCGSGKSFASLAAYFYYKMIYPNTKLIIVTNNSSLYQFAGEISKFFNYTGHIQVFSQNMDGITYQNTYKKVRKEKLDQFGGIEQDSPEIILMNYPIFRLEHKNILQSLEDLKSNNFKTFLILDEATSFKNPKTDTHKAVCKVRAKVDKILALTATLTRGKLEEIFFILKGLGITLCSSFAEFERNFMEVWQHPKFWRIRKVRGYKNIDIFRDMVLPHAVVLRKADISDSLPAFSFQKVWVDHSPEQIELIQNIYSGVLCLDGEHKPLNVIDDISDPNFKMISALTEQGYLKRTLSAPELVLEKYKGSGSPKITEILRMLEEDFVDEKIVIYTPSKKFLHLLESRIKKEKVSPFYSKVVTICGDLSPEEREQSKKEFTESSDTNIMILDNVGGEALNLQAAQVMILCSMPDTYGFLVQLAGRLSRLGSKHKNLLLLYLLTKDSQDEDEYRIIMQQGIIFHAIHGEVEKGLLDVEVLKDKFFGEKNEESSDIVNKSLSRLLLYTRKSRKKQYLSMKNGDSENDI